MSSYPETAMMPTDADEEMKAAATNCIGREGPWPVVWSAMAEVAVKRLAATPTPPTLSEDLRAAIEQALQCTPFIRDSGLGHMEIDYDCGDPWEILRAALARAQVKAS